MKIKQKNKPSVADKWLLPGIIIAMVASNQEWLVGSLRVGYIFTFMNFMASSIVLFKAFYNRLWPKIICLCVFVSAILAIISQDTHTMLFSRMFIGVFFCATGAVLASKYPTLIYKQVMVICLLNLVFMLLQVYGVQGAQFVTTHGSKGSVPTLFVGKDELLFNNSQARPAGLSYSNIILSFIIMFGIALHYPRRNSKLKWGGFVLCLMVVMAMAKIVIFGFALIALYLFIAGNLAHKLEVLRSVLLIAVFYCLYALFFPGLFAINLSQEIIDASIFGRLADIARGLPQDSLMGDVLIGLLKAAPQLDVEFADSVYMSGIPSIVSILPYIFILFAVLMPMYLAGFRRLRSRFRKVTYTILPTLMVAIIYPFAFSIWEAPIYWFVLGCACLPVFVYLQPKHFDCFCSIES